MTVVTIEQQLSLKKWEQNFKKIFHATATEKDENRCSITVRSKHNYITTNVFAVSCNISKRTKSAGMLEEKYKAKNSQLRISLAIPFHCCVKHATYNITEVKEFEMMIAPEIILNFIKRYFTPLISTNGTICSIRLRISLIIFYHFIKTQQYHNYKLLINN